MTGEGGWEVATSAARLRQRPDAGMATAELAVGMVSLLLVLALVLTGLRAGMDRAGAISVAGLLAREAAHSGPAAAGDLLFFIIFFASTWEYRFSRYRLISRASFGDYFLGIDYHVVTFIGFIE